MSSTSSLLVPPAATMAVIESSEVISPAPRRIDWRGRIASTGRDYAEVVVVLAAVTVAGWFVPFSYHALGHIYLLVVIALSLHVGRWAALAAAILSALAWNYVFVPPRMSFSVLDFDDVLVLGTYFVVALIGGQVTARLRDQERLERQRERRATALFHLTRALATAASLDEAVAAALKQANDLFDAQTTVLLPDERGILTPHRAGTFRPDAAEQAVAAWCDTHGQEAGRFTDTLPSAESLHLPMRRGDVRLGVFVIRPPADASPPLPVQREFMRGFAAQIALLVERERLRAASEREKFFAESDRLHRTLLDSVSHELKTPLAVLRSASEKMPHADAEKRAILLGELTTAMRRLDHLVANLLDQTRLEAGALSPQPDWCDVRDLIGSARRATGSALGDRPVIVTIPPDMPLFMADAPLMEHILVNLLLNAALHTPPGTTVRVSAGLDAALKRVRIVVADNGPGLPEELREDLFQKFRRGKSARAGGIGLGLSIVRGFTLAQGGEVTAGSSPEGGASFTISLPYTAHEQIPPE